MATLLNMNPKPADSMASDINPTAQNNNNTSNANSANAALATDGAEEETDADKSAKATTDTATPVMAKLSRPNALQRKITELETSGWRPPEESIDSDDDYNDVEMMMSDSEDEEKSMRKIEERMMADDDDDDDDDTDAALARRLSLSSAGSNHGNLPYLGLNDEFLLSEVPFSHSFLDGDLPIPESDVFREGSPLARTNTEETVATQRRVRFEDKIDVSDGNTTDSDADSDFFPDLFIQQDHLDPKFRRLIEKDDDYELYKDDSSNAGSEWDFEADEMRMLLMEDEEESDSSAGSSGYESDDGDTTDEEPMPPPPKKITTAPTSPSSSDPTPKPNKPKIMLRRSKNKRTPIAKQPKMGTFMIDPHRPVLTIDGVGVSQKSTLWPAKIQSAADKQLWQRMHLLSNSNSRATSRTTSPRQSVQLTPSGESDQGMVLDDGDDFFDSFGALRTDQVIGPPEAFTPFVDVSAAGAVTQDDAIAGAELDQDPMCFLNFDSEDEDEEMPDESDIPASPSTTQALPEVSNSQPTLNASFDLLAHLDRTNVGSFRRNQQFAKHVGSLPSHPALRASLSESNAMQTGRRAAANTPITPLRKKKLKGVGARQSPIPSPLNKDSPIKRRGPVRGGFSRR